MGFDASRFPVLKRKRAKGKSYVIDMCLEGMRVNEADSYGLGVVLFEDYDFSNELNKYRMCL